MKNIMCDGENRDILIVGSRIAAVVPAGLGELPADVRNAETVDCTGMVALPGFVNAHTHAAMTLFRGVGEDVCFADWIDKIWVEEEKIDEEYIYWATKVACLEMIKTGTTAFLDQYWMPEVAVRAVSEMGMRAVLSYVHLDHYDKARSLRQRQECMKVREASLAWPDSFWHRLYMETILSAGLPFDTVLPIWLAESPAALYRLFLIAAGGTLLGAVLYGILRLAGRLANLRSWKPLALCLVPLIGWSLFSGICHTGFSVWQEYGLDSIWYRTFEWCILGFASTCSLWLGMKTILPNRAPARLASLALYGLSVLLLDLVWLA